MQEGSQPLKDWLLGLVLEEPQMCRLLPQIFLFKTNGGELASVLKRAMREMMHWATDKKPTFYYFQRSLIIEYMYLKEMIMFSCKKNQYEGITMDFGIAQ